MGGGISRRGMIGGALAGAAGLAAGRAAGAPAAARRRKRRRDVVVVGGGIAGLSAARAVAKAGRSVVVLEARDRVGGRTLNHEIGKGKVVEVGGQWVGPTQDNVLGLIDELGLKTFDTYIDGKSVYYRNGTRSLYDGVIPPTDNASLIDVLTTINELNAMAATVPVEAPWDAPRAAEWDGQTFETWLNASGISAEARELVELGIASVFAAEPRDLSLLFVAFYIAMAAGDFNYLISTAGGAQEKRIVGGSQLISVKMAKQLGRSVRLEQPARTIRRGNGGVAVWTGSDTWFGRRVIVTVPPALIGGIRFQPSLPPNRAQLDQRMPMGTVIKCMGIYDKPFWRDQGLNGMATSNRGPVKLTYDNSPPDGSPGVLLGFIEGQAARDLADASKEKRQAAVIESFVRYFGAEAETGLRDYVDKSWAKDPWSRGCYGGFTPPGVLVGYRGTGKRPVGRIHWAGTESASEWGGYMDGAIDSGLRAAGEVLAEL